MKKTLMMLSGLMLMVSNLWAAVPAHVGETVDYKLSSNRDRSSWVIKEGSGTIGVVEYQPENPNGPGYIVKIAYDLEVRLKGRQNGEMGLFIPEKVFNPTFMTELAQNHPMKMGSFTLDYEGTSDATDSNGTSYLGCHKTRLYDITPMYESVSLNGLPVQVLWFNYSGSITSVTDLQIKLKSHPNVAVLGAVQIDIKGKSNGIIPFEAGMDLVPTR